MSRTKIGTKEKKFFHPFKCQLPQFLHFLVKLYFTKICFRFGKLFSRQHWHLVLKKVTAGTWHDTGLTEVKAEIKITTNADC